MKQNSPAVQHGFTLVEMMIVTAILVPIITALYAKRYGNVQEKDVERKAAELQH